MARTRARQRHPLVLREKDTKKLFSEKRYLEIIAIKNKIKTMLDAEFLNYSYFNNKVSCLLYTGLSYAEIGFYKNAYKTFSEIHEKLSQLKRARISWTQIKRYPASKEYLNMANEALSMIKEQIDFFNKNNYIIYLSNIAYVCYKLGNYDDAIVYYKKALCRDSKDIQLNLGIAQAQYYHYRRKFPFKFLNDIFCKKLPKDIRENFLRTINMLFKMETSFDSLLAIGKMFYFLGEYPKALLFVQKAIELANKQNDLSAKIHAYDWLSRIAYKTKYHEVAAEYYNKIIEQIIECSDYEQGAIHPKPDLYKMLKYLTQNKEEIKKHDVHYIKKYIWGGIIAGIILEGFEIYSGGTTNPNILIGMVILVVFVSFCFINIYK